MLRYPGSKIEQIKKKHKKQNLTKHNAKKSSLGSKVRKDQKCKNNDSCKENNSYGRPAKKTPKKSAPKVRQKGCSPLQESQEQTEAKKRRVVFL